MILREQFEKECINNVCTFDCKYPDQYVFWLEQQDEWMKKCHKYLRKKLTFTDEYLKHQLGWVNLQHGLRIDNNAPLIQYH